VVKKSRKKNPIAFAPVEKKNVVGPEASHSFYDLRPRKEKGGRRLVPKIRKGRSKKSSKKKRRLYVAVEPARVGGACGTSH